MIHGILERLLLQANHAEMQMSLSEFRPQFQCPVKVRDRGIELILREQYPSQQVVTFRAARRQAHNFLEGHTRACKIASLQRCHSLAIKSRDLPINSSFCAVCL